MLLALSGCLAPHVSPDDSAGAFSYEGPTTITSLEGGCSVEDDTWSLVVETEGWTSGGLWSLTADAHRVEAHEIESVEAAADGAWDRLELSLDIVADPRDAEEGKTSAWLCDGSTEANMAWRVMVSDPETGEKTDCATWGAEIDWNAIASYSECDHRQ
ncbi:MAG TPA: hypothetical protein QGF58_08525 [Myxococcota bacterium]|nr:hypothetical protein [Myxococcota bacterium]